MKEYRVEKIEKSDKLNAGKVMVDTVISGASIGCIIGFLSLCFKTNDMNSMYYYVATIGSYFVGNKFYDDFLSDLKKIVLNEVVEEEIEEKVR